MKGKYKSCSNQLNIFNSGKLLTCQTLKQENKRQIPGIRLDSTHDLLLSPGRPAGVEFDFCIDHSDLLSLTQPSVKFLLVDQLPPAAQSLQFAEQSSQPAVLHLQLVDFFFLTKQAGHTDLLTYSNLQVEF